MPRKRETKMGKVDSLDVRSKSDIAPLESILGRGPLTIVLVYADWCGHCQRFKENMWNEVSSMENKKVNTAAVHYDMVDKTSLKNAKIDGYPSLLLVGTDKKPANFKTDEGETNAMPTPQSVEELKSMVNTAINSPVKNANTVVSNIVSNIASVNNTTNTNTNINTNTNNSTLKQVNSYIPAEAETLAVPDTSVDVRTKPTPQAGGQRGGNETLLAALTRITAEAGHAGALLLAATEYADMGKKLTRRLKKKGKGKRPAKTAKRTQRK
jgi:thiol-disulfide isomerase/thioredoxin